MPQRLTMGASCKGVCLQKSITKVPNSQKYQFGLKRCSWCEVWLDTDEIRCTCCKMILRTKSRNKKKLRVSQNIEKFGDSAAFTA